MKRAPWTCFDAVAWLYDRSRPKYPAELFDELSRVCAFTTPPDILEVACGTGQASVALAPRCRKLVCVERGPNMAALARANLAEFPNARVEIGAFETWDAAGELFDLVFCATAWHWMDPDLRYTAAARLLRPGGYLAIVKVAHVLSPGFDPFFERIQACYRSIYGESSSGPKTPEEVEDFGPDIDASGLFDPVTTVRFLNTQRYTADQHIDLLSTHSDHIAMNPADRDRLFDEVRRILDERPEPILEMEYLRILNVARLKEEPE